MAFEGQTAGLGFEFWVLQNGGVNMDMDMKILVYCFSRSSLHSILGDCV